MIGDAVAFHNEPPKRLRLEDCNTLCVGQRLDLTKQQLLSEHGKRAHDCGLYLDLQLRSAGAVANRLLPQLHRRFREIRNFKKDEGSGGSVAWPTRSLRIRFDPRPGAEGA